MGKLIDKMMPAAFSPLYINETLFDSRKALALFKFTHLFFPQFGPGPDLVNLLLDMENQSRRVIAAVPLKSRPARVGKASQKRITRCWRRRP